MDKPLEILKFVRPGGLPYALVILLVAFLLSRLLARTSGRLSSRFADRRPLIHQVGALIRFMIYLAGWLGVAAMVLELTPEMLLAVGGAVAVAVGFALKDIVASIVAGLIILIDRPFQVGDRVAIDGYYGEIRSIGLRSVRLVTLDDTQVTIPNNRFLTESAASGNAGAVAMMIEIDFWIGVDQDVTAARQLVEEALTSSRYLHIGMPWSVLVSETINDALVAVRLRAKGYVLDLRFEKAFESDVTERVLIAFRDAGIQPPAILHRSCPERGEALPEGPQLSPPSRARCSLK